MTTHTELLKDLQRGLSGPLISREALKPFAQCVLSDNGDVTINTSHITQYSYRNAVKAMEQS
jgi:hypothetical protein